jgi:hypothetical protein
LLSLKSEGKFDCILAVDPISPTHHLIQTMSVFVSVLELKDVKELGSTLVTVGMAADITVLGRDKAGTFCDPFFMLALSAAITTTTSVRVDCRAQHEEVWLGLPCQPTHAGHRRPALRHSAIHRRQEGCLVQL